MEHRSEKSKMRKSTLVVSIMIIVAMFVTACGGGPTTTTTTTAAGNDPSVTTTAAPNQEAAEYKDTIDLAITAQPPTLDPVLTTSMVALNIASNFYETLYTFDEHFVPTPMLAESYTANDDNTEFVFVLRKGVKFHDGSMMMAEDVVASMNYWLEKSGKAKSLLGKGVFEKVDDHTVKATFENPANDLLNLMSSKPQFPAIRPAKAYEGIGEEGVKMTIGTGPYTLAEVKQDQYVLLTKFDDYVGLSTAASGFSGQKTAPTKHIKVHIVPDGTTRVNGLIAGTYDVIDGVPTENVADIASQGNLKIHTEPGGTLTLFFNVNEGVLANLEMRKAIVTGINNEEIMIASFVEKDFYTLDNGYMNLNSEIYASKAGADMYNVNNPEKAKEMLNAAGYKGEKVRLLTTPDYEEMYNATVVLADQLKKMGVDAEIVSFDFSTFMEHREDLTKWDIFITSNNYQVTPQQLLVVNPQWAGANDERLASYVKELQAAKTDADKKAKWDKIQDFLYHEYLSSIAIGQFNNVVATNDKIEGFVFWQAPLVWNAKVRK